MRRRIGWLWGIGFLALGAGGVAVDALGLSADGLGAGTGIALCGMLIFSLLARHEDQRSKLLRLERIEAVLNKTDVALVSIDCQGVIKSCNDSAARLLGRSQEELQGTRFTDLHPDQAIDYAERAAAGVSFELILTSSPGASVAAMANLDEQLDDDGHVSGYVVVAVDITARKQDETALREKQELIESIAITSPTIFYIYDLHDRRILYSNRAIPEALGYTAGQIAAMGPDPLPAVLHPEDLDKLYNRLQHCAAMADGYVLETELRCLDAFGNIRWLQARDVIFKRTPAGAPQQILVNMVDVTERKLLDDQVESQVLEIQDSNLALEIQATALEEANAQLEALAFADGLTGIANHRSFQENLARHFEDARKADKPLSLMLLDVDRFKDYNDTYGHPSGDIVLKRVAQVLGEVCPVGCIPARYGGEEFAVLCPGRDGNEVYELAEHLRAAIESTPWPERNVTVSIGVTSLAEEVATPSLLVSQADTALYVSKARGRNQVTAHSEAMTRRLAS